MISQLPLAGPATVFVEGTWAGTSGKTFELYTDSTHHQDIIYYGTPGWVYLDSRNGSTENASAGFYVGTAPTVLMMQIYPSGNVVLTQIPHGNKISVINTMPSATASSIGVGATGAPSTFTATAILVYSYLLDQAEISQVYNYLQSYSAGLGSTGIVLPTMPGTFVAPVALPNNLALTPPMGWDAWPSLAPAQTDAQIRTEANLMISTGLAAAGYNILDVSDIASASHTATGQLTFSTTTFPYGMGALAAYIHSLGLKVGMYTDPGPITCAGPQAAGMFLHEAQDAATYASWGIDYVQADRCSEDEAYANYQTLYGLQDAQNEAYGLIGQALSLSSHPPIYMAESAIYGYPGDGANTWLWGKSAGINTYRTHTDISPSSTTIMSILEAQPSFAPYSGPGVFADADVLMTGLSPLTDQQGLTHFAMWSMLSSPLFIGQDLTTISSTTLTTLSNTDLIAVDQDPLGKMALRVSSTPCGSSVCEVWAKQLTGNNTCAIALLNQDSAAHSITATFATIAGVVPACGSGPYITTRDLIAHTSLGTLTTNYTASIPAYGVAVIKVAP
jgi:alpha-galactosidase